MSKQRDAQPKACAGVVLSETWQVFPCLTRADPVLPADALSSIPKEITIGQRRIKAQKVKVPDGSLDLGPLHGGHAREKTAWVFASLEVREEKSAYLGFGADYWLQAWLDGKLIMDTTQTGNMAYPISKSNLIVEAKGLSKGKHVLAVRVISGTASSQFAMGPLDEVGMLRGPELTWKPHIVRIGNGKGGWTYRDAECRFLHAASGRSSVGAFGLAQMENGEVLLLASWKPSAAEREVPVAAFSKDRGATWSDWRLIPGAAGRPMMLANLGKGTVTFQADGMPSMVPGGGRVIFQGSQTRFYSHDYGRTWPDRIPVPPAVNGGGWMVEGNALVECDPSGKIIMAETGLGKLEGWPAAPSMDYIRWSYDGGRTWTNQSSPKEWLWKDSSDGKTYTRGVSEGSLVRAANGWLVAALRPDMPAWWITRGGNDNHEGAGVSISKDNGKTWSPLKVIHPAGRMHPHLIKMGNGDLVMIYIMRQDIGPDGKHYAGYRRGCAALVSRDNGLTWDPSREYRLHDFDFADAQAGIGPLACGHTCSALLDDGSILTAYAHYISKGIVLVRWTP